MVNVNDLISDNKLLIKILAIVLGVVGIWANNKFHLGFTPDEVKSAAAMDAAFILGLAIHKTPPDAPAAPSTPSADPGAVQKVGG